MNTRRTTVNRRKSGRSSARHHLLEVNVRSASIRRHQRRAAGGLIWKVSAAIVTLALLGIGGRFAADRFFFRNPEYSLRHLELNLDGVMTPEEFTNLTGFTEGANIFNLDLAQANERLAAIPGVLEANLERNLPDTVKVTLKRREPVFLVAGDDGGETFLPGKSFLCDRDGVMLRPALLDQEFLNLPVLRGVDLAGAVPGKRLENPRLPQAIMLRQALSEIPEEGFRIISIDVSKPYATVVTDASNARFTFGNNDLPAQLDRLRKLLAHCRDTGRRIDTANLIVTRNTPVTFVLTPETRGPRITPAPAAKKSAQR